MPIFEIDCEWNAARTASHYPVIDHGHNSDFAVAVPPTTPNLRRMDAGMRQSLLESAKDFYAAHPILPIERGAGKRWDSRHKKPNDFRE
jgi:hypothetical protein